MTYRLYIETAPDRWEIVNSANTGKPMPYNSADQAIQAGRRAYPRDRMRVVFPDGAGYTIDPLPYTA